MKKDYAALALEAHEQWKGKLEIRAKAKVDSRDALSIAYTPGVAAPCLKIAGNPDDSYRYTGRSNTVAVVSDGSAVLGLGNIGGLAGMPVMEGKCVLFKEFGGVDAIPLVLSTQDPDEIVGIVKALSPSFGGINLEDISAPRCFEIERRLIEACDIPIFHDDQHGTAVVVLAAMINALKLVGKKIGEVTVCLSGPGAAGTAIARLLIARGVKDVVCCDSKGILYSGRPGQNWAKDELAAITDKEGKRGGLAEAIADADIFVGVSQPGIISADMVRSMKKDPIVFALSNPTPEILPEAAQEAGAVVIGTGRSDYPNQINNVLAFPGIFRGALDVRARRISESMKIAAAEALAAMVGDRLDKNYILPDAFDPDICGKVSSAVAAAAIKEGLNRA